MISKPLKGVAMGSGYFSHYHFDAWQRVKGAEIVALMSRDATTRSEVAANYSIPRTYDNVVEMLDAEKPDFVDIITPPNSHLEYVKLAAERGIAVICQKALAPTFSEAVEIVEVAEASGIQFMVHDNFRFQPWHREIKRQIAGGLIGDVQSISCRSRMGDGWGPDAYLSRQPYFRNMERFLVFEMGVHIIDVFRFLGGEIDSVFASLRRLNPVIAGEDRGILLFDFSNGGSALWDADRYHESLTSSPRYVFGEFLVEGTLGAIRLDEEGCMLHQPLGGPTSEISYYHGRQGFGGDSVKATFEHFCHALKTGEEIELNGREYLRTLAVQEAVYQSNASGKREPIQPIPMFEIAE